MPVVPHAFAFFDSAAILMRADALDFGSTKLDWEMDVSEAQGHLAALGRFTAIDRGRERPAFISPLPVALLGGEPLARPDELEALLAVTVEHRLGVEVGTTASWVTSEAATRAVLEPLRGRVHSLRLQTSALVATPERQEQIAVLLRCARHASLTVDVHCGVAPGVPLVRALLELEVVNDGTSFLHVDPALDLLFDRSRIPDTALTGASRQRCAEKFGFFVLPGGDVHPCPSGVGRRALRLGNLLHQSVADVVDSVRGDASIVRLRDHGPRGSDEELLGEAAAGLPGRYLDNCDFHRQVLAGAELLATTEGG